MQYFDFDMTDAGNASVGEAVLHGRAHPSIYCYGVQARTGKCLRLDFCGSHESDKQQCGKKANRTWGDHAKRHPWSLAAAHRDGGVSPRRRAMTLSMARLGSMAVISCWIGFGATV